MKAEKRSTNLIVDFEDGFAVRWAFAIPEAFKDELDIKWTNRIAPNNGTLTRYERQEMMWTQGSLYNFKQGEIFYDTRKAYDLPWCEALQHIKSFVQIKEAAPAKIENDRLDHGFVRFQIYCPNGACTSIEAVSMAQCTQKEFVAYLRTGFLPRLQASLFD